MRCPTWLNSILPRIDVTLISYLGKLFTAILNDRLQKYADLEYDIKGCHAGFRKDYSTNDNILILHSLIELVCKSKRSLFCAFIDLKQAFDRVCGDGLWKKLVQYHINGKCWRIIQNMYKNIKSCVLVNHTRTDFFISNIGVRQGENLSPFLFIIFLNGLETFFRNLNVEGVQCNQHPKMMTLHYILKYLIFCMQMTLLYSVVQRKGCRLQWICMLNIATIEN